MTAPGCLIDSKQTASREEGGGLQISYFSLVQEQEMIVVYVDGIHTLHD